MDHAARISFSDALICNMIATNQVAEFREWVYTMSAMRNLTSGHAGAEQIAAICRIALRRDMTATERQWNRLQSAYWISTDGYGKLMPSRLSLIPAY